MRATSRGARTALVVDARRVPQPHAKAPAMSAPSAAVPGTRDAPALSMPPATVDVVLQVNGERRALSLDPRTTLLDCLRDQLQLTGSKKGCDHGQCGACTVHVDGRRVNACLCLAIALGGRKITSIEGLGTPDALHPMQAAFVAHDGYQCGYCTAGQIMSATALDAEGVGDDAASVREAMSGNLCRCGAYSGILAAVGEVRPACRVAKGGQ